MLTLLCSCLLQAVAGSTGLPAELAAAEVRAVEVDASGDLWVATRGRGLARVRGDEVEWVESDALPRGIADLQMAGAELWAVGLGGAARRTTRGWRSREIPPSARVVFTVTTSSDVYRSVWLASDAGAIEHRAGRTRVLVETDGLPHAVVHQVLVDREGAIWLLCRRGVARFQSGTVDVFRPDLNFRRGIIGPDGLPWFGTTGGLLRWTGSGFEVELEGVTPYPVLVASDGSVWAGSASDGVLRRDETGWSRPLPETSGHEVFDVAEGPDGTVWIATTIGLRRIEPAPGGPRPEP